MGDFVDSKHSFHRARTRTRRTGYAHPRTWNLAGRLVGAAKILTY